MEEFFPFEIPRSDSPRLAWMKRYSIKVTKMNPHDWYVVTGAIGSIATDGNTEDEALEKFARRNSIRLWNEEAAHVLPAS